LQNIVSGIGLIFLDGYCSTVQGLLDWFEVELGFTELLFIQIDLCVMCVYHALICKVYASQITHLYAMGWLHVVGSLK